MTFGLFAAFAIGVATGVVLLYSLLSWLWSKPNSLTPKSSVLQPRYKNPDPVEYWPGQIEEQNASVRALLMECARTCIGRPLTIDEGDRLLERFKASEGTHLTRAVRALQDVAYFSNISSKEAGDRQVIVLTKLAKELKDIYWNHQ
jgi:hypothetical protein